MTLNRPERLNAITWKMVEGVIDFTEECSRDNTVRVIVITGAGRAFSSGDNIVAGMGESQPATATLADYAPTWACTTRW